MIDQAARGRWEPLAEYYLSRTDWVGSGFATGYHFTVLCAEEIGILAPEEMDRVSRNTFMGNHLVRAYYDVCEQWP